MRLLTDPPELPPEVVWRSLLPLRPQRRISYRIRGAEQIPLHVTAIPAAVEAVAWDYGAVAYPPDDLGTSSELRERAGSMAILSEVLWTPKGRAFPTVSHMGDLDDDELRDLCDEVFIVLSDICPNMRRSDGRAWAEFLRAGAAHPSNRGEASVLACSIDLGYGGAQLPRPDRYWGVPLNELLDGHWMIYQAARDVLKDRT